MPKSPRQISQQRHTQLEASFCLELLKPGRAAAASLASSSHSFAHFRVRSRTCESFRLSQTLKPSQRFSERLMLGSESAASRALKYHQRLDITPLW